MVNFDAENPNFFTSSINDGYQIGKGAKSTLNLLVFASNADTPRELAVEFSMNVEASFKVVFDSFFITLNIPDFVVTNAKVVQDNVGLYERDYDTYITGLIEAIVKNINTEWAEPWDLAELDPTVGFLRSMFTNLQLSPYITEEFIFFGFSYMLDFSMLQ